MLRPHLALCDISFKTLLGKVFLQLLSPQAECCEDHTHCCPAGTICDTAKSSCVNDTVSIPWAERTSAEQPRLKVRNADIYCITNWFIYRTCTKSSPRLPHLVPAVLQDDQVVHGRGGWQHLSWSVTMPTWVFLPEDLDKVWLLSSSPGNQTPNMQRWYSTGIKGKKAAISKKSVLINVIF